MMAPSTAPPLAFKVDDTLGAAFVGFAASCLALGILTAQVYRYYQRFPSDRPVYKYLVIGLWLLEVADQAFIGHAVYYYMVTHYADPIALIGKPVIWSLVLQIVIGALGGAIAKICFAMRVWRFSKKNIPVTAFLLLLVVVQLIFATVYTSEGFANRNLPVTDVVASYSSKLWGTLSLTVGAISDIVTAAALCWYLRKLRSGYKKSDNLVQQLTVFAVNTGVLTSAASLATLILYNLMPRNFIFMGVYFLVSKLYAISLMAALNARSIVRGRGTDEQNATPHVPNAMILSNRYPKTQTPPCSSRSQKSFEDLEDGLQVGIHQEISILTDLPNYTL